MDTKEKKEHLFLLESLCDFFVTEHRLTNNFGRILIRISNFVQRYG